MDLFGNVVMHNNLHENDIVVLKTDIGGIPKGTRGTIVFDYESSGMYEVEFFDDEHSTIDVIRVCNSDLKRSHNE